MIVSAPTRCCRLTCQAAPGVIAALTLLTLAPQCLAGVNARTTEGPAGESVGSIVVDPTSPQTLYAAFGGAHP